MLLVMGSLSRKLPFTIHKGTDGLTDRLNDVSIKTGFLDVLKGRLTQSGLIRKSIFFHHSFE